MKVPLLDLKRQYSSIKDEMDTAVHEILDKTQFILGEKVKEFEENIAQYCGCKYAVGVASGTDALLLALRACGVGPGDEVIIPNFTFIATSNVISRLGATPAFVDIDRDTYNMDPNLIEFRFIFSDNAWIWIHFWRSAKSIKSKWSRTQLRLLVLNIRGKKREPWENSGVSAFSPVKTWVLPGMGGW